MRRIRREDFEIWSLLLVCFQCARVVHFFGLLGQQSQVIFPTIDIELLQNMAV